MKALTILLLLWPAVALAGDLTPTVPAPMAGVTPPRVIPGANDLKATCPDGQFYPPVAIHRFIEGAATYSFWIKTDGSVRDVVVAQSSGSDILDSHGMQCIQNFHYAPATQNGAAVEAPRKVTLQWKIHQ